MQPMAGQRFTAVGLVTVVLAVIVPVADEGRVCADACRALELSWAALELRTVRGLIRVVPTIVLCVTLPPEGDALVILAHKLEGR